MVLVGDSLKGVGRAMPPEISRKVKQRLRRELVIWLTTVRRDGMPQPTPVWFLWDGDTFLIYSQPNTRKLATSPTIPRSPSISTRISRAPR